MKLGYYSIFIQLTTAYIQINYNPKTILCVFCLVYFKKLILQILFQPCLIEILSYKTLLIIKTFPYLSRVVIALKQSLFTSLYNKFSSTKQNDKSKVMQESSQIQLFQLSYDNHFQSENPRPGHTPQLQYTNTFTYASERSFFRRPCSCTF